MDKTMKKIKILLIALLIIMIATAALFFTKTKWHNDVNHYGNLNCTDGEDEENDEVGNDFSVSYDIVGRKEYYVNGSFTVLQGEITVTITSDDEVMYQKSFSKGEHEYETEVCDGYNNSIIISVEGTDDLEGIYDIKVNTRCRLMDRMISKIKENFVS